MLGDELKEHRGMLGLAGPLYPADIITEMKDENRQLKRTVWIVRAENAFSMACYNETLAHGWRYFRGDLQKA